MLFPSPSHLCTPVTPVCCYSASPMVLPGSALQSRPEKLPSMQTLTESMVWVRHLYFPLSWLHSQYRCSMSRLVMSPEGTHADHWGLVTCAADVYLCWGETSPHRSCAPAITAAEKVPSYGLLFYHTVWQHSEPIQPDWLAQNKAFCKQGSLTLLFPSLVCLKTTTHS